MTKKNNDKIKQNEREQKAKEFGRKLKKIMTERNISSNKLANSIGISRASFNKYFNGGGSIKNCFFFRK